MPGVDKLMLQRAYPLSHAHGGVDVRGAGIGIVFPALRPVEILILYEDSHALGLTGEVSPGLHYDRTPHACYHPDKRPSLLLSFCR